MSTGSKGNPVILDDEVTRDYMITDQEIDEILEGLRKIAYNEEEQVMSLNVEEQVEVAEL